MVLISLSEFVRMEFRSPSRDEPPSESLTLRPERRGAVFLQRIWWIDGVAAMVLAMDRLMVKPQITGLQVELADSGTAENPAG
jgi:hypothetical protein